MATALLDRLTPSLRYRRNRQRELALQASRLKINPKAIHRARRRRNPDQPLRRALAFRPNLDVSMEETSICVIDKEGGLLRETKVETNPDVIFAMLKAYAGRLRRVGHEVGSLSPWLQVELSQRGLPVVCLETHHARSALKVQHNKTDRSDAYGLAQLVRTGWFRAVHMKGQESHRLRLLLTHRRSLKRKLLDIENEIRQSLKVFGLLRGARVQRGSFETRVRKLTAHDALIGGVTDCMLRAWSALWSEYKRPHALLIRFVGCDELCRRFVVIPSVGPVTALSFKAAVDDPTRFAKSKTVGAHFGLTARRIQSGDTIDIEGHISKCGDGEVRAALYEAASAMLVRSKK